MIQPVNEELEDDLVVFWQWNRLLVGLFETSRKCRSEEIRVIGEKILVYNETLLLGAN